MKIGFIGVGFMGQGMAANLIKAGHDVMVKGNRNRAPVEALVALGAFEMSPAQMARECAMIHLCLSDSKQVEAVMRGEIIPNAKEGVIVIDTTTANPVSTRTLAAELARAGGVLVDAPLGRTPKEAAEGTLDAMVGATPEVFAQVLPVIEVWAKNITHTGPVGSGHTMKLLMNFISLGYAALYSEAAVLGAKNGISPQVLRDVIGGSRLNNGFFEGFMRYTVDRDAEVHKFTLTNAAKDVGYAADMAASSQVVSVMGAAIRQLYTHGIATGQGDLFVPMLGDIVGRLSGVDMEDAARAGAVREAKKSSV